MAHMLPYTLRPPQYAKTACIDPMVRICVSCGVCGGGVCVICVVLRRVCLCVCVCVCVCVCAVGHWPRPLWPILLKLVYVWSHTILNSYENRSRCCFTSDLDTETRVRWTPSWSPV
jgi:hypothetical protein